MCFIVTFCTRFFSDLFDYEKKALKKKVKYCFFDNVFEMLIRDLLEMDSRFLRLAVRTKNKEILPFQKNVVSYSVIYLAEKPPIQTWKKIWKLFDFKRLYGKNQPRLSLVMGKICASLKVQCMLIDLCYSKSWIEVSSKQKFRFMLACGNCRIQVFFITRIRHWFAQLYFIRIIILNHAKSFKSHATIRIKNHAQI